MLKISILKVENPFCLWGHVVLGPGGDAEQYNNLQVQMNLFYHDVTRDARALQPVTLEDGQVCVAYWSTLKSWCRATVESVFRDSVSSQVLCLLVDHGERIVVPSHQIRVAIQKFLLLPFWVRRFHLAGIRPTTLRVPVSEEKAELIGSSQWDSSATLYLHNLLQASAQTEAVLHESKGESTSIDLYMTIGGIKICVNDDLVAKKFAYYSGRSPDGGGLAKLDRCPVMLSSSTFTTTGKEAASPPAISPTLAAPASLAASPPQSRHQELKVTKGQTTADDQSETSSAAAAVSETLSDPSENADSCLAADLTRNLHLFGFLKFLNPALGCQQVDPHDGQREPPSVSQPEEATAASVTCTGNHVSGTAGTRDDCDSAEEPEDDETSSSSTSAEMERPCRFKEDSTCSRLLEWLNPVLLNPEDDTDVSSGSSDPIRSEVLVHSAFPVEPCTSVDDAPITDAIRRALQRKQYCSLSPADRYSWPAVARGCNTIVVSNNADQPLSYLPPLLTHILLNSSFTSTAGPVVVLVCPGWEKARIIQDLLEETKVAQTLHPVTALVGVAKDEAKNVRIPKNCVMLVTTPFSLVRLLACHSFLFLHLFHLVLDEADQLFSLAPDQMAAVLQHFHKVTSSDKNAFQPQQLVASAKRWTSPMEHLVTNHMPHPCVVMTMPEEAALYGRVQQVLLMASENNKVSVLLGALDFSPDVGQKTLIVAQSAEEVEDIVKALTNKSAFCLKTHEGLTHLFDSAVQQWRKDVSPGTHVILVTTNECLSCLGITDATCVVHYGFPSSPKVFGSRLLCMAENFRNLSERDPASSPPVTRSVLLISERNSRHVVGVLRYLARTNAPLPPELLSFAQGVHEAREDQKTNRPLCSYLKSFGVCRESRLCPDRHRFNPQLDQSTLPASGVIEVLPLYVKTASVFCGRIVRKEHGGFDDVASDMASYYGENKAPPTELREGGFYAALEDEVFHRVKVLSVPDRGDRLFFTVLVWFLDVGKEEAVKSHQIFHLPDRFHSLPAQAVEMVVCRVKPADAETDWHPKVTRAIGPKIRGRRHRARVVLSLGNTVFLDPMVRVTQVPGMKTVINEYNVSAEILNTGMGVSNPEHVDLLRALRQDAVKSEHTSGSEDGALEARVTAVHEVLSDTFRVAEGASPEPPLLEPLSPIGSTHQPEPAPHLRPTAVCDQRPLWDVHTVIGPEADLDSAEHMREGAGCDVWPRTSSSPDPAQTTPEENGVSADESQSSEQQVVLANGADGVLRAKSFHPQVRWYQTSDSVVVTVKLMNPECQRCDFYLDRVVYSGTASARFYRADLELHAAIAADRCSWEMKSNEPVLRLVKERPGLWDRLVKNKNIFVSFDVEHIEEDEDGTPNGRWFFGNTGEENGDTSSDSGSESD